MVNVTIKSDFDIKLSKKDLLLLALAELSDKEIEKLWESIFKLEITLKPNGK